MKIITETDRLILRELQSSDAEVFYELNADPEVMKYTGDPPFESVEASREFLKNYKEYAVNGYGRWAVIFKGTNAFVGWCGLKRNEQHMIDLGFRFFRKEWGKGYATESAKASLKYGFEQLKMNEIIGRAAIANEASIHVLKKIGMEFWKYDGCKGIADAAYYKIDKEMFSSISGTVKNQ